MKKVNILKKLTRKLAASLEKLGIKTFPTETYFFLAKVPMDSEQFAEELKKRNIVIKVAKQKGLEDNFVKFTTSTPKNNKIVIQAVKEIFTEGVFHG